IQKYRDLYLDPALRKGLCQTEEEIDSTIYAVLKGVTKCDAPVVPATTCTVSCDNSCTITSQELSTKRSLMLADMLPYTGQYSKETPAATTVDHSMYDRYNVSPANNPANQDPALVTTLLLQHPEYAKLQLAE